MELISYKIVSVILWIIYYIYGINTLIYIFNETKRVKLLWRSFDYNHVEQITDKNNNFLKELPFVSYNQKSATVNLD